MREVENYEISLVNEPGSDQEKVFLSFDMTDLPDLPAAATSAVLTKVEGSPGSLQVTFEDTSKMEDVVFPQCPAGLVAIIERFEWLGVVGLSPDGEQVQLFSSIPLLQA
jgi:hypothetical protein